MTKIRVFEPSEILFMNTVKDSKLVHITQENVSDTTITFFDRRIWSEKSGHEYVDRLAFPEDIEMINITLGGNYFSACSFAAVGNTHNSDPSSDLRCAGTQICRTRAK